MIPTTNEKLAALKANPGLGAECSCFVAVGGKNQNEQNLCKRGYISLENPSVFFDASVLGFMCSTTFVRLMRPAREILETQSKKQESADNSHVEEKLSRSS